LNVICIVQIQKRRELLAENREYFYPLCTNLRTDGDCVVSAICGKKTVRR